MEVGAKPDVEYLERLVRPSENNFFLRPQPQAHRLIVVDVGSCNRLICADFHADIVSLGIAFKERDHDVGIDVIPGRQRSNYM